MNVPTRLVASGAVLGLAFGGAALTGAAIDPTDEQTTASDGHASGGGGHPVEGAGAHASGKAGEGGHGAASAASGLAVSEDGYTLEAGRGFFTQGKSAPFRFRIRDERGRVVRDEFELEHERELHLIVVRRDTAIFQHLHPHRRQDGTWSVDLTLREPGVYRAYADFKLDGVQRTLAADLFVPGDFRPRQLPEPSHTDATGTGGPAGLDVELEASGVRAGRETRLSFAVTGDGRPFEQLEPYLGAKGHLVALREGDLGYLHVHPVEGGDEHAHEDGSTSAQAHANEIEFGATFPTAGRYRLFLQFRTGGEVRTVDYTLEVRR